ncbi:MAG TPA: hypothetical protein VMH24_02625, partial [Candidatus Sulfotelmatobacter sp.]|nr:hypothetical protein [Candidatus Sulfotelmatobacter sp.]
MVPRRGPATASHPDLTPSTLDPQAWADPAVQALLDRFRARLGPIPAARVIAIGLATVDLDRAAADLPDVAFHRAPDDDLLGARGFAAELPGRPGGVTLLLLEPSTEGRLTAFLARHGEGLAAVYMPADPAPVAGPGGGGASVGAFVPA